MTLGVGDHVSKLARHYDPDTKEATIGPDLAEGEMCHEFEVIDLTDCNQDDPDGFRPVLKKIS